MKKLIKLYLMVPFILVILWGMEGFAQMQVKLQSPFSSGAFGHSVSISGDRVLVGAPFYDTGWAILYEQEGSPGNWPWKAYLVGDPIPHTADEFGHSVSIDGNWAVVGAPKNDTRQPDAGAAYIFELGGSGTIVADTMIQSNSWADKDHFGWSVDISGERIIVGEPDDNLPAWPWDIDNVGIAHIFERDASGNWFRRSSFRSGAPQVGAQFGRSVSISGDWAIVGEPWKDFWVGIWWTADAGEAYFFKREGSSWVRKVLKQAGDPAAFDAFGYSVAIDGDYAIVGAPLKDLGPWFNILYDAGAAYIFERSGDSWGQVAKLTASDKFAYDNFGISVAIRGHRAYVGAPFENSRGLWAGATYLFERDGSGDWNQIAKLQGSDIDQFDEIGRSVAIEFGRAFAGAPGKNTLEGAAYIFDYNPYILDLAAGSQPPCNPLNNTYSQDVIVTYVNPPNPLWGNLEVNGRRFSITGSPQTVTLDGLISDGQPVDVTASLLIWSLWEWIPICTLTEYALFTAPVDCQPPVITCPADITVNNDPGMYGAEVTYTTPIGTDNLPGATTELTGGFGSGAFFPIGTTTEEYRVTDAAGNTATCSFTVTVIFNEPVIVNNQVTPVVQNVVWDPVTKIFAFDIALTNIGSEPLLPPMKAVISNIYPSTVTLNNPDGGGSGIGGYWDYSNSLGPDGELSPGETSETKRWEFYNPDMVGFYFSCDIYAVPSGGMPKIAGAGENLPFAMAADIAQQRVKMDRGDISKLILPTEFALEQNYPNPFNPETTIRYQLSEAAKIKLGIFNVRGQEICTLVDEEQKAGYHQVTWDGKGMASGIYFYRIEAGGFTQTRKMIMLK